MFTYLKADLLSRLARKQFFQWKNTNFRNINKSEWLYKLNFLIVKSILMINTRDILDNWNRKQ